MWGRQTEKGEIGLEISSPLAIAWLEKAGSLITYSLVRSPLLARGDLSLESGQRSLSESERVFGQQSLEG